jgi:hypothetical protein
VTARGKHDRPNWSPVTNVIEGAGSRQRRSISRTFRTDRSRRFATVASTKSSPGGWSSTSMLCTSEWLGPSSMTARSVSAPASQSTACGHRGAWEYARRSTAGAPSRESGSGFGPGSRSGTPASRNAPFADAGSRSISRSCRLRRLHVRGEDEFPNDFPDRLPAAG